MGSQWAGFSGKWYEQKTGKAPPARKAKVITADTGEDLFVQLCPALGLPVPVPEYVFHPDRLWRMDYAWPDHKVFLEVEGGAYTGGRHTRGPGFVEDMRKYNAACELGWRQLRAIPQWLPGGRSMAIDGDLLRQLRTQLCLTV